MLCLTGDACGSLKGHVHCEGQEVVLGLKWEGRYRFCRHREAAKAMSPEAASEGGGDLTEGDSWLVEGGDRMADGTGRLLTHVHGFRCGVHAFRG